MYASLAKLQALQRELDAIAHEDVSRKGLIRLAVLKALQLDHRRFKSTLETFENRIDELSTKKHEYDVAVSKLRQQYITKERIQELKIEQLHDEVQRLKLQLKGKTTAQRPQPARKQPGIFSTSPYLLRAISQKSEPKNYLSPTFNSINRSNRSALADTTVLTPIPARVKRVKRGYTTARTFLQQLRSEEAEKRGAEVTSAPQKTVLESAKDAPSAQNASKDVLEQQDVLGDLPLPTHTTPERPAHKMTTRSAARGSPTKTPSRLSFVENFDRSDDESSDHELAHSQTPSRTPGSLFEQPQSFDEVLSQHSFSQNIGTSTPTAGSANNSAVLLSSSPSTRPKRKLSLRRALLAKVVLAANKSQAALDDDMMTDYRDEHFADTSFGSPKAATNISALSAPAEPPRKRRNVFKID